jgi:hypothetical protein
MYRSVLMAWQSSDEITCMRDWQTMTAVDMPPYHELLWPALQAVLELGGSASIGEIVETVINARA